MVLNVLEVGLDAVVMAVVDESFRLPNCRSPFQKAACLSCSLGASCVHIKSFADSIRAFALSKGVSGVGSSSLSSA